MTKTPGKVAPPKDTEPSLSLGNYLQRERQKKKLSLQEIAIATKIPKEALVALESGDKTQLPVAVFAKGFVKIYSGYLGLNQNHVLKRFQKEWDIDPEHAETPEMLHEESMAQISPFYLSGQFYLILITICLFLGLAFFFFNANEPSNQDLSLNSIREMQTLPPVILQKNPPVTISRIEITEEQVALPLISPTSAGKIARETDDEIILASRSSVVPVAKVSTPPKKQAIATPQDISKNSTAIASLRQSEEEIIEIIPEDIDEISPSLVLPLDLHISFLARTRISISQDESSPAKYIFSQGEESTWSADKTISMQVEKAENVRVTLNGQRISLPESNGDPLAITLPADLYKR